MENNGIYIGNEIRTALYKKDSKGKIRVLNIFTDEGRLNQASGIFGGKIVTHSKVCKPKNIGRANETTATEQAISQAIAKVKEKLTSGYFKTVEEANSEVVILPMLAKSFKPEKKKIDWNAAWAQPKFDGQRCLAFIKKLGAELMSRTGKPITTMPHIVDAINALNLPVGTILDGELYGHGLSFQDNMRLIKKDRGEVSKQICYHVYDTIVDEPFLRRNAIVNEMIPDDSIYLKTVETVSVTNEETLRIYHEKIVSLGYEGTMLRWGSESYKINGRSSHLLKNKDFIDISIQLLDVEHSDARPDQGIPVFKWIGAYKDQLRSGVKGSHKFREDLLKNKLDHIGKMVELRFFEYSENGVPRFPVMVGFRNDK